MQTIHHDFFKLFISEDNVASLIEGMNEYVAEVFEKVNPVSNSWVPFLL